MIYISNLPSPGLVVDGFKHLHVRPMAHSFGHSVASDWSDKPADDPLFGIYKNCGLWTHDEAALLTAIASPMIVHGEWVDIGAHTGWTAKHINWATNSRVVCVDPMLAVPEFERRLRANTGFPRDWVHGVTSAYFFDFIIAKDARYLGFCIDGDHECGKPLEDAMAASRHLRPTGVIVMHDFLGQPVREAVTWLMDHGFRSRVYLTPHMVAVCWRGAYRPPEHLPDPNLLMLADRCQDFDFSRCE